MKRLKFLLVLAALISATSAFAWQNHLDDGTDIGNGGDEYAKQFINLGKDLAESLAEHPLPGLDAQQLLLAIEATKVNSDESLELGGHEVDAINYPNRNPKQIVVSRKGWDRMSAEPHRRAFLVLHEYLGIMGIDDSRYQISSLLDRAGVCGRTGAIRNAIEEELKKSCYRILSDDLLYVRGLTDKDAEDVYTRLVKADFLGMPRLEYLHIKGQIGGFDSDLFAHNTKILNMFFGSNINLSSCQFLKPLRKLEQFGAYEHNKRGTYITSIEDRCFENMAASSSGTLVIDGAALAGSQFLSGSKFRVLSLFGINLDKIDIATLMPMSGAGKSLNLYFDGALAESFMNDLKEKLGKTCIPVSGFNEYSSGLTCY